MHEIENDKIKEILDDRFFELEGVRYDLLVVPRKTALKIVGISQMIAEKQCMIGDDKWFELEELIFKVFSVDNDMLIKKTDHFEKHSKNYMTFMSYAISVIAYPFV